MGIFKRIVRTLTGTQLEPTSPGQSAPVFTLKDASGESYALPEALKQGPVLLAFFKKSCPVCQFTFPFLERLHQGVKGAKGVRVWGVSQDDAEGTRAFARAQGCTFPLLLDEEGYPVSNEYGLSNVPTLFLVDPSGEIRQTYVGFDRKGIETVAEEFGRHLGKAITVFRPEDIVPAFKPG